MAEATPADSGSKYVVALQLARMVLTAENKIHANGTVSANRKEILDTVRECVWSLSVQKRPDHVEQT